MTTFDNIFSAPREDPSCCPLLFIVVPVVVLFFLFRAPRGTSCCPLLSHVVFVVVFSFPFRAPRGTYSCKFVQFVVKNLRSAPREDPSCCPLLFIVVFVVVFLFPFRAPRGTPSRTILPFFFHFPLFSLFVVCVRIIFVVFIPQYSTHPTSRLSLQKIFFPVHVFGIQSITIL